jgi:enoyl-CoA hydratase/carnithine racemase
MSYANILVEVKNGVATIIINRPKVLNALSKQTKQEISSALQEMRKDSSVRVVILKGAGNRAFSSGQDISETKNFTEATVHEWITDYRNLYETVRSMDVPVIAAIRGYATGAGWQLALLADIRVASKDAKFGMTEVNIGIPCITGMGLLMNYIGPSQTLPFVLAGRIIDAKAAERLGLVDFVVASDRLEKTAHDLAREIATKPSTAIKLNKERFRQLTAGALEDAYEYAIKAHKAAFATGEPQKCMEAFLNKRK